MEEEEEEEDKKREKEYFCRRGFGLGGSDTGSRWPENALKMHS